MTSSGLPSRRAALIGGAAVLAVVVAVLVVLGVRGGDGSKQADTGPSSSGSSSASSSAAASGSAPSASASATGGPTRSPAPGTPSSTAGGGTSPAPAASGSPRPTAAPVRIGRAAQAGNGVVVRVTGTRSVQGKAELPGEIGGPAVAVDLSVSAARRTSLDQAVVNLYYGATKTPAVPLTAGTKELSGSAGPGSVRRGTYVFSVPRGQRGRVVITCDLTTKQPVVVFRGAVR